MDDLPGKIRSLQREAAQCTDELLEISNGISKDVIQVYSQRQDSVFALQARVYIERLRRLSQELENIQKNLASAVEEYDLSGADSGGEAGEIRRSADISAQLVIQNIAAADQKTALLKDMLISMEQVKENMDAAKKLEESADIMKLKGMLKKMSE